MEAKRELLELVEERERRDARRKLFGYYPDTGPLRRELYRPHMDFFAAGAKYNQRVLMAPNRIGKTEGVFGYEMALHLTGRYPGWWVGRRFNRPVRAWAVGKTSETVREILQVKLLGPSSAQGTGMIPGDDIVRVTRAAGLAESADTVYVTHASGGVSILAFKSYDQGRRAFEGTEIDVIGMDEEPPLDIYTECLMRTMTTDGIVLTTFTPLLGMSAAVLHFLGGTADITPGAKGSDRYLVTADWSDAPHLTDAQKQRLIDEIPAYQRDARTKGIPQLGAGAIYPLPESDIVVPDFPIPEHYPRAYGLDVGWNRTAAIWGARDVGSNTTYLYAEHYRGQAEPAIHAEAIKGKGAWVRGVIDPAARARSQKDGTQLMEQYAALGLKLEVADNGVESGLSKVWEQLSTGKLKVFRSCSNWLNEFRLYRRNEKGVVVKEMDHLMDATRYLIVSGMGYARTKPPEHRDRGRSSSLVAPMMRRR